MVMVGVAGWSYADWNGRVYPSRKGRGFHPLPYLARYLDCMELNSSFYALPRPDLAARWVQLLEPHPDFRFTVKLHASFTHGPLREISSLAAQAFRDGIAPLAEAGRCLALLVQFPVSFVPSPAAWKRLATIRGLFPRERLVLELRHRDWFVPKGYELLSELDLGLAHIDLPAARDHPPAGHPSLGPLGYVRLHGRNRATWFDASAGRDDRYDYRYDEREVQAITERLRVVADRTERALLIANNHFGGQAVANAIEIRSLLDGKPALAPESLVAAFPDLRARTRPEGQMSLF
jgi:uncharacterized protein YecE (DUF72 family)